MNSANQVRNIFAILRVYNNMTDPEAIWEDFKKDLIEDFIFHDVPINEAEYLAIDQINQHIIVLGGTP